MQVKARDKREKSYVRIIVAQYEDRCADGDQGFEFAAEHVRSMHDMRSNRRYRRLLRAAIVQSTRWLVRNDIVKASDIATSRIAEWMK